MANLKTVGVISRDELTGITEIAEPVGVVCGITPVTNPTSTAIFKALIALKTRNPIIFALPPERPAVARSPPPASSATPPSPPAPPRTASSGSSSPRSRPPPLLMNHPGVALILATGGNAMVRAAYSCGKPALGVGAGNVPAYIEKSAKLERAVNDVVLSKAFDNGMICASEQAVILDTEIYDEAMAEFAQPARLPRDRRREGHARAVHLRRRGRRRRTAAGAKLNADGRRPESPQWIAEQAGFTVPEDTSIILAEVRRGRPGRAADPREALPRCSPCCAPTVDRAGHLALRADGRVRRPGSLGPRSTPRTRTIVEEFGKRVKAVRIIDQRPQLARRHRRHLQRASSPR